LIILWIAQRILDFNQASAYDCSAHRMNAARFHGVSALEGFEEFAHDIVVGDQMQQFFVKPIKETVFGTAQARCNVYDHVEDWLDILGRAADDPQDFCRCCLLFQCFGKAILGRGELAGSLFKVLLKVGR
jgi:hypothetical protein